tara:strand:+ start:213 stop:347 length:135 start_codon:yes stop_codon:yes gene_type:complete
MAKYGPFRRGKMPKYKGKEYSYDEGGMKAYRAAKMADKKKRKKK